ncbi:MAG: phosphotransferase [Polyangiaceae bacterium]|nr:phosphotransferase [Polyangiaceae bacterium]
MTAVHLKRRAPSGARERASFEHMLSRLEGCAARLVSIEPLTADRAPGELKRMGYGIPMLITYRARGGIHRIVFRTQSPNWFGHDRRADRAALAVLAADTYGEQPRHVRVLDMGAIRDDELVSLRDAGEFYLATSYVEGTLYANDLRLIEESGRAGDLDIQRAEALARHIAEVHCAQPASCNPAVYTRAIRDLVGSGEGIFGIVDSYPEDFYRRDLLVRIEELALVWRWKLGREKTWRLRRTHGDFHPYNVLFRSNVDFTVLDASRGGAGEPADDLAAMSINYLFTGMRVPASWPEGVGRVWKAFFSAYLDATGDEGSFEQIPPFLAWRALVLASPAWYPDVPEAVRVSLLEAAVHWLESNRFRPESIESDVPSLIALRR